MNVRKGLRRLALLTVVTSMPLLGMAGIAGAKTHHHKGGGSGGSGTSTPSITVTVDPNGPNNPLFEVGQSEVFAVVQVETQPAFADDQVTISSQQLQNTCTGSFPGGFPPRVVFANAQAQGSGSVTVALDNEGNATVTVAGLECAPGQDLVEADLAVAPFYTATTIVTVNPPTVTTPGVFGEPQTSGVAEEVETGDTTASGDSDISAVFFVEENPVYAEQTVEIGSTQLQDRCQGGWEWFPSNFGVPKAPGTIGFNGPVSNTGGPPGNPTDTTPSAVLDDDGNAAFVFYGISCAAGPSTVVADVRAGTHDTFTTTFTVLPPAVTI